MFDALYGNEELKARLSQMLVAEKLPHGVLFCGEDGLGRGFTARLLAAEHLAAGNEAQYKQVMEGTHPECIVVEGEGVSGLIKIDQIRQVRARVQETSFTDRGKVIIIKNAQNLGHPAANALLKVLEDPPEGVLFILTAPSTGAVLNTILSRCVVFALSPLSQENCEEKLRINYPVADVKMLCTIFDGRLGLCYHYAADKERKDQLELAMQLVKTIERQNQYGLLSIFAKVEKDKLAVKELLQLMRFILFAAAGQKQEVLPRISFEKAKQISNAVFEAERAIAQNANMKLTLTALAVGCK